VKKFIASKSQKKIIRRNNNLIRKTNSPWATEEQYDLFQKYLQKRHAKGGMADMDVFEFAAMIEESSIETRVIEYYNKNLLESVCLTDFLVDGLSMVYSFFDPDKSKQSLGTFMILDHIALALELEVPYLYLGYWVPGSSKMDYKVNFKGVEIFQNNSWQQLSQVKKSPLELHPLNTAPVSEQVSSLSLPDTIIT
jgi:arginine-tRNA-protein transferase